MIHTEVTVVCDHFYGGYEEMSLLGPAFLSGYEVLRVIRASFTGLAKRR